MLVSDRLLARLQRTVIPASFCRLVRVKRAVADPTYVYYALQDMYLSDRAALYEQQSTGISNFQFEYFLDAETLRLPPLPEQRAIASVLGSLDDKIDLNRRMNATLEATARAIFKAWFVDFEALPVEAGRREPVAMVAERAAPYGVSRGVRKGSVDGASVRVDEVAEINARVLRADDPLESIEYIEISEVSRGEVGVVRQYRRGDEPSRARRVLRDGDTVLSTVRPDRGAHFYCVRPAPNLIASTGFAVVSPRTVPSSFLYAALTAPEVGEYLGQIADGGAYPAVRPEKIGELSVPMPNDPAALGAYHAIAGPLFERADANRRESRTLAALRDTLLPKLLSGEVRVKDIA
ncbi:MAG: restriction endonuclease subunit S [Planctomycetes bacterium]|nr:restriction endonuclease subunit S [Planctomycetota bacterium]